MVKGIEIGYQCEATVDFGVMYREVYNHETLTREFIDFVEKETNVDVFPCKEAMTGEDFGFMVKEIPGFMFWLGVESEYGLHHAKLLPNEEAIGVAIKMISKYISYKGS